LSKVTDLNDSTKYVEGGYYAVAPAHSLHLNPRWNVEVLIIEL